MTTALPIALHHGSLDVGQRRKVEAAMAAGALRAVVCTSTLDLGIDWGDVDLVIQIGAPKGCARLVQRIGRANHRLDEPSRALLAPSQPLRSAGMPLGAGGRGRRRARRRRAARGRARLPGPAHHGLRVRRAVRRRRALCRSDLNGALRRSAARAVRPRHRSCRHRRLCAAHLRPLPAHRAGPATPAAGARATPRWRSSTA